MKEDGNLLDWLEYRWKMIRVSDTKFFRFIWITAIAITLVTVLISAGVTAKANKKAKAEEKKKAKQEVTTEEELATVGDATVTDASATDADSWMLILVNKDNALPANFEVPEFTELRNNQKVDSRIYPDLQAMFDDARAQGYSPYITSSYRTKEEQQAEIDSKVNELLEQGKTQEQAKAEAATLVMEPGKSEHETGLAIDVGSDAGEEQQNALWTWLNENCYSYGFVIRYPEGKEDITGVSNEPWHLRYVGKEASVAMHESGQCLEEYLAFQ